MVAFLKKFFTEDQKQSAKNLAKTDRREKARIATCAILLEIANSDDEFSPGERIKIIEILRGKFELSEDDARELIEISQEKINKSIDLWGFTNIINNTFTPEEKNEVIEAVWEVIYADGELSGHEDRLVHKLSYLLGLKHEQLIAAKLKAKGKTP